MGKILDFFSKLFKSANFIDDDAEMSAYYGSNYSPSPTPSMYGSGSDGSKYYRGLSSSGSSPVLDNDIITRNARSAYHDTPAARAMIERFGDTVIGSGLRLNPTPNYEILGITPEQSEQWSDNVRARFHLYASSKKAMVDERCNLYQSMRLMEIFQQRDGEYFVRFHYSSKKDLQNPLQLSFIDPLQIRGTGYTSTRGYQYFGDGIKRDHNGKEVAYLVNVKDEKNKTYKEVDIPAFGRRSGKRMMTHCYKPEYAGQGRGISRIGHILQEFENLTDFTLAQIIKAINESNIAYYVKPSKDAPASNPLESITHTRPSGPYASDPSSPESSTIPPEDYVRYINIQEATSREPGSQGIFSLAEGEDFKTLDGSAPSDNFHTFVDSFVSYLCASNSMPIEVLLNRFNSNYSASRAALIMFWRVADMLREDKKADILDYVYEAWLNGEIASGKITAPGWRDPQIRAAWLSNNWLGSPIPNIDPLVTGKANELQIRQGSTTLDEIARNTNGSSGKANRLQLAREFSELPIPPWDQKPGMDGDTEEGEKKEDNGDEE